jgi:hypothetical protein
MELAQLDGSHVGGNEGAGQLYRRGRVLQERSSRRTLNKNDNYNYLWKYCGSTDPDPLFSL